MSDNDAYIPPPYSPLHDLIDVFEIVTESLLPRFPFRHVPFPDENVIRENVHPVIVVLVVLKLNPPSTFTIDTFTLAAFEPDEDVTVTETNSSDPFEI